jgi:heme-degrading monooxygenase HmoA
MEVDMFARNVALRLKPNSLSQFKQTLEKEVLPILRKQAGFQDEIVFATNGGADVMAISLWDTKEHAEAYNTTAYPEVLKRLNSVLDGSPKVRIADVISCTIHKDVAVVAA